LFLGKKGEEGRGGQQIIFLVAELMVGALILIGTINITLNAVTDTDEEVISNDLGLTIMTVTAAPYDLYYKYAPNLEDYSVTVDETTVKVESLKDSASYRFLPMKEVLINSAFIAKTISFPIRFSDNKVLFEDLSQDQREDFCAGLQGSFKEKPSVSISITAYSSADEKSYLELLKNLLDNVLSTSFSVVSSNADINLAVGFSGDNSFKSTYYFSDTDANYQKLSCYVVSRFKVDYEDGFDNFYEVQNPSARLLILQFGKSDALGSNPDSVLGGYASTIKESLEAAIK